MTRRWQAEILVEFDTNEPHAKDRADDEAKCKAVAVGGYVNKIREIAAASRVTISVPEEKAGL